MFLGSVSSHGNLRKGWIEVVCGPMFSGKTEELIRRVKRSKIARQKVELFKPDIDKRYHDVNIVSHDAHEINSIPVASSVELLSLCSDDVEVIGIDEAQFFDQAIIDVCHTLANKGIRVIVAGLDKDFLGKPFGPMPDLMAIAEYVTKIHAICIECGDLASYSYRTVADVSQIRLGEKESYLPLCRACYNRQQK